MGAREIKAFEKACKELEESRARLLRRFKITGTIVAAFAGLIFFPFLSKYDHEITLKAEKSRAEETKSRLKAHKLELQSRSESATGKLAVLKAMQEKIDEYHQISSKIDKNIPKVLPAAKKLARASNFFSFQIPKVPADLEKFEEKLKAEAKLAYHRIIGEGTSEPLDNLKDKLVSQIDALGEKGGDLSDHGLTPKAMSDLTLTLRKSINAVPSSPLNFESSWAVLKRNFQAAGKVDLEKGCDDFVAQYQSARAIVDHHVDSVEKSLQNVRKPLDSAKASLAQSIASDEEESQKLEARIADAQKEITAFDEKSGFF